MWRKKSAILTMSLNLFEEKTPKNGRSPKIDQTPNFEQTPNYFWNRVLIKSISRRYELF